MLRQATPGHLAWGSRRSMRPARTTFRCTAVAASSFTLGATAYKDTSTKAINLANQLRELGVASEIALPTLVTAGDQSSGKSSVVEAIAGIPLPRASGTCTRCPTEVRLRRMPPAGTSWQCVVKLKREYSASGGALTEVPQEVFCTITRQQDVTLSVSAAQATLLNPSRVLSEGPLLFLPNGLGTSEPKHSDAFTRLTDYELEFTPNSVVLEVQGAEVDLTIVDLPGIIQSHPKGESYVDIIKTMVVRTIQQEHVIIAMMITAMNDPENQAINLEARKVDPEGKRTIGIITKPDNIPDGDLSKWVAVARNRDARHALTLGYYVVKNPGQLQLDEGITPEQARKKEMEFFSNDRHWGSPQVQADIGHRLGCLNLSTALSDKLEKELQLQMPAVAQRAINKLKEVEHQLRALPAKPSSDVQYEFQKLLNKVAQSLSDQVRAAGPGDKLQYQRYDAIYMRFEDTLMASLPAFEVRGVVVDVADASDDNGCPVWTLEEVKDLRLRHMGRELPTFSPYSTLEELISEFRGQLRGAMEACLASAKAELQASAKGCVDSTFQQFPGVLPLLSIVMATHLESVAHTCLDRLLQVSEMEDDIPFTMNKHYFMESRNNFQSRLKMAHLGVSKEQLAMRKEQHESEILAKLKLCEINFSGLEEMYLAMATPDDNELELMAATLAYFKVVYKRILDYGPLHVRGYLLHTFASKGLPDILYEYVKEELQQSSTDLQGLMAEDASVDNQRRQLLDRQSRLTEAISALQHPTRLKLAAA